MVKLVVHIGHGKTGSSSIQKTLLQHASELARQGVKYLGLMLEHATSPSRMSWQNMGGSDAFFDTKSASDANNELYSVLLGEMSRLEKDNVSLAIWSNEWLATRGYQVLPALSELRGRGIDIEAQCYVRRHDEWAQSAYLQWGIKHKSYEGPLRDFESWLPVFGQRDFRFGPSLKTWDEVFGANLRVFNYDSAGDVVQHFLAANGISNIAAAKDNVTPDPVLLAAQSVFNGRAKRPVLPMAFNQINRLARKADENQSVLPTLDYLNASDEALADIVESRKDDIKEINHFLLRSGEPLLSFDKPVRRAPHPSPWEMDQFILKLVYSLAQETVQLRNQVTALEAQLNTQKDDKAR